MAIPVIDYQLLANAGSPPVSFKAGELIFAAGDKGDKMCAPARLRSSATARLSRP